ncbi:hypothetical protein C2869_06210 [Saccharobesus litoralis]|uniref:Uncharacterized protein n=1 Tax=Saccharobesus litoralis TaxID=2172099 RepID=A0A2S0VPB9_9ALTE|nr:DUF6768 family protein [Saccharobesus litoralis]AWB66056.1 hypothetical protein C2869_06210 [Saccharobesus litoralis]
MKLDDQIKQSLQQEAQQLDAILAQEPGIFGMINNSYRGALRIWLIIASVAGVIATLCFVWCGYQFVMAELAVDKVFWGVWFIVGLYIQAMIKLWFFMEMNRTSTVREIKRLELAVERLYARLEQ